MKVLSHKELFATFNKLTSGNNFREVALQPSKDVLVLRTTVLADTWGRLRFLGLYFWGLLVLPTWSVSMVYPVLTYQQYYMAECNCQKSRHLENNWFSAQFLTCDTAYAIFTLLLFNPLILFESLTRMICSQSVSFSWFFTPLVRANLSQCLVRQHQLAFTETHSIVPVCVCRSPSPRGVCPPWVILHH